LRWAALFALGVVAGTAYVLAAPMLSSTRWAAGLLRLLPVWFYLFMAGMILQWQQHWVERFFAGRFLPWLGAYLVVVAGVDALGFEATGNYALPLSQLLLAGVVIAAAFTRRHLATRMLRGHDISYGVYLYHMPVYNVLITLNLASIGIGTVGGLALGVVSTFTLAALSWWLVERPALRLKPAQRPRESA
jgi:peptidoglycan/LPS O-acetylase OafA/YrhL